MFRSISSLGRPARLGGACLPVALVACLGLSGCCTLGQPDLDFSRVEDQREEPECSWAGEFRRPDSGLLPHAVTNRGMQIERNLGVP